MSVLRSPEELLRELESLTASETTNNSSNHHLDTNITQMTSATHNGTSRSEKLTSSDASGGVSSSIDIPLPPVVSGSNNYASSSSNAASHSTGEPVQVLPLTAPHLALLAAAKKYQDSYLPVSSAIASSVASVASSSNAASTEEARSSPLSPLAPNPNPFVQIASPPSKWEYVPPSIAEHIAHSQSLSESPPLFTAVAANAPSAAAVPKKSSRIRTSSFSKIAKEKEAAVQAQRMQEVMQGLDSSSAATSALPYPSSVLDGLVSVKVGKKKAAPIPNYATPTESSKKSVAGAATAATEAIAEADTVPVTSRRRRSSKKKKIAASPPIVEASLSSTRPRVLSSYGDLLSYSSSASSTPLPLTLAQCQQCLVYMLRLLRDSSKVDPVAWSELMKILQGDAANALTAAGTSVPSPSLSESITALEAEQDAILIVQTNTPHWKLLSQLAKNGVTTVNANKMQALFRWYLADMQRNSVKNASTMADASNSVTNPATPSRAPAVVSLNLTSPLTIAARTRPTSDVTMAAAASSVGANESGRESGTRTPVAGATSVQASQGKITLSEFMNALASPLPLAAAQPILVKPGRYDHLPSRLLDHFRRSEARDEYRLFRSSRSRLRSSSRSSQRSNSTSSSRSAFPASAIGSAQFRSRSADRPASSAPSTPRTIPNLALTSRLSHHRSTSSSSNTTLPLEYINQQFGEEGAPLSDRTDLAATARKAPRSRSRSRGQNVKSRSQFPPRGSVIPPSLHVSDFSAISSKLQIAPLSSDTSQRVESVDSVSTPSASPPSTTAMDDPDSKTEADNMRQVVAEIERMNQSLERLLSKRSTFENERAKSIRRPRAVFPGAQHIYKDQPAVLEKMKQDRNSRSRTKEELPVDEEGRKLAGTLTGSVEPPHIFSPARHALLPPNAHAYSGPKYSPSGHRTAGYSPSPRARDMSYLDFETNLKHQWEHETWRDTIDGKMSPHALRRNRANSRSRSVTPSKSPRLSPSSSISSSFHAHPYPTPKLETVPQARHMGYLSPAANSELFRQTSTYATILAGGSTGGSSQLPLTYVRNDPPVPDRSIVDKQRLPQQRGMSYLPAEVNQAHVLEARTWRDKLDGTHESARTASPAYRYRVEDDPFFRHHYGASMVSQARPMSFLSPEVNAEHLRMAQDWEHRVKSQTEPQQSPRSKGFPSAPHNTPSSYPPLDPATQEAFAARKRATRRTAPSLLTEEEKIEDARHLASTRAAAITGTKVASRSNAATPMVTPARKQRRPRSDEEPLARTLPKESRTLTREELSRTPLRHMIETADKPHSESDDPRTAGASSEPHTVTDEGKDESHAAEEPVFSHTDDSGSQTDEEEKVLEASVLLASPVPKRVVGPGEQEFDPEAESAERYYEALHARQRAREAALAKQAAMQAALEAEYRHGGDEQEDMEAARDSRKRGSFSNDETIQFSYDAYDPLSAERATLERRFHSSSDS